MSSLVFRKAIIALFLATMLIGLAFIVIMPPFEGFDEDAHYSRIISTAYIAQLPFVFRGHESVPPDRLTSEIDDYQKRAPMPSLWLSMPVPLSEAKSHATPDYDIFLIPSFTSTHTVAQLYKNNYKDFFSDEQRVADYVKYYREMPAEAGYAPGLEPNWEYQHPPLYYYLFAPAARFLADQPLVDKVIFLRILNYVLVMVAIAIGLRASFFSLLPQGENLARETVVFGMLFPFITPCFWGEFGRLGNDNLCLLIFAITWSLLLQHLRKPQSPLLWFGLGFVLGLGWLVKFTMVVISGGIVILLLMYHLADGKKRGLPIIRRLLPLVTIAAVCSLVGGSWSFYTHLFGQAQGSLEMTWMIHDGDFLDSFQHNMSWLFFLHGINTVFVSSVFLFNYLSEGAVDQLSGFLPVLGIGIFLAYLLTLRGTKIYSLQKLPIWMIVPPLLMLFVHIAYSIIELGYLITSGRYLLVVLPAFMLITGIGIREFVRKKNDFKIIAYTIYFLVPTVTLYLFWLSLAIFGGCAAKKHMGINPQNPFWHIDSRALSFGPSYCFDQLGPLVAHLEVVSWPVVGLLSFALGWLLLVYSVYLLCQITMRSTAKDQLTTIA